jgi:hypothetical protein
LAIAGLAGFVTVFGFAACGSGEAADAASTVAAKASSAVAQVTSSESSREPVTTTREATRTITEQQVTSVTASKSVKVQIQGGTTRTTTGSSDSSGDSGLPAWAWVLIGAGAVGLLVAAFALGRRGKQQPPEPGAPA